MPARGHLWPLVPPHGDAATAAAAPGRQHRYRYVLAIPLLLALEAAASAHRTWRRLRPGGGPADEDEGLNGW